MNPDLLAMLDAYAAGDLDKDILADWLEQHGDPRADEVRSLRRSLLPVPRGRVSYDLDAQEASAETGLRIRVLGLFPEWANHVTVIARHH